MRQEDTSTIPIRQSPVSPAEQARTEVRLEALDSLPVRLETAALDAAVNLAQEGKTVKTIASCLSLEHVVVLLELTRERERRLMPQPLTASQQKRADAELALPRLSCMEMNRVARGTHVPNHTLRDMVERTLRANPGLRIERILNDARYNSSTQGKRHLGLKRNSGRATLTQTIRLAPAVRIAEALKLDPHEVAGL
jgi:hypothetical protein